MGIVYRGRLGISFMYYHIFSVKSGLMVLSKITIKPKLSDFWEEICQDLYAARFAKSVGVNKTGTSKRLNINH